MPRRDAIARSQREARVSRSALVLGARSQIGRFLLPRLGDAGWSVHAGTRGVPPADEAGRRWYRFDLFTDPGPALQVDTVFSLGPLDGLVAWLERSPVRAARIIAFGSTSVHSKQDSDDPRERALAHRLQSAEARLRQIAAERGAGATLLRPTLIYGGGGDRNLSRMVQLARRWRVLPLPRTATGLRQPVHAADLADAAWQAAQRAPAIGAYDLPGGETLPYREMVRRVLACLDPPLRIIALPPGPLRIGLRIARRFGALPDASDAILHRLQRDLVYDSTAARRDLAYAPRAFRPEPAMFVAAETG
jgi:nucleoside-diphosphate-sugar epimerase